MSLGFISYSHTDNQPSGPKEELWVEKFHSSLQTRIQMKLGTRDEYLWYDPRITRTEELIDSIRAALARAQFFLAIVSPSFVNSDWCPGELLEFLHECERRGSSPNGRLFRIAKEEVDRQKLHARLQGVRGYDFIDRSGPRPGLLYSSSEKYWNVIEDIAHDFCAATQNQGSTPSKGMVYIPDSSLDAVDQRAVLRRELVARGYEVSNIASNDAKLSIHVIGTELRYFAITTGPQPCLVWITPNAANSAHAKTLRESDRAGIDYEIIEGLSDIVKAAVLGHLEPKPKTIAKDTEVYLICDATEQEAARSVREDLIRASCSVHLPLFIGDPTEIRQDHEDCLRGADSALVLWQNAQNPSWLRAKIRELNKAAGLGRKAPFSATAVLSPHPVDTLADGRISVVRTVQEFLALLGRTSHGATA